MAKQAKDGFNQRVRMAMGMRDMSLADLAAKMNISRTRVYQYRSVSTNPNSETVVALAKALEVSTDFLLGMSDSVEKPA